MTPKEQENKGKQTLEECKQECNHTNNELREDEFRKQYDELGLKAPKNSMPGMERELIIDFWRKALHQREQALKAELLEKVEELSGDRPYREVKRFTESLETIINNIFK